MGVDEDGIAAIGSLPEGHGILGELIRHPEPLRLGTLSQHASSYGLPPNHPPMNSFLGVPIRVRAVSYTHLDVYKRQARALAAGQRGGHPQLSLIHI